MNAFGSIVLATFGISLTAWIGLLALYFREELHYVPQVTPGGRVGVAPPPRASRERSDRDDEVRRDQIRD